MSKTKKKKKSPWKSILIIVLFLGCSFGFGMFLGTVLDPILEDVPAKQFIPGFIGVYVFLLLFNFLQIVVHETGHLIFGLLTGYQYSSFRIGSFMWVKLNGKIQLKRHSLAGTGGQCLMAPPDFVNGKIPYALYNFGGYIANIVVSVIPLVLVLVFWQTTYWHFMVIMWAAIGLFFAVTNGIPMKMQGMPNDGHNAMSLGKNPEALKAFWLQMKIVEQIALGKRLRDLPVEWFELPDEEGMKNSLIATIAVFACNRLVDSGEYAEAAELMERLVNQKNGMVGIHKHLLNLDRIYCEMVGENRPEKLEELYDDELKKVMKAMKKSPSTHRVQYLYSKYVEKDEKKAALAMTMFEKTAKTYPYPHEIEGERELISYAEERLSN